MARMSYDFSIPSIVYPLLTVWVFSTDLNILAYRLVQSVTVRTVLEHAVFANGRAQFALHGN